jgi:hypothetical protein
MAKQRLAIARYDSSLFFHSVLKARQVGRPRRRGEDSIKMDFHEGWGGMDWIDLVQDRDR